MKGVGGRREEIGGTGYVKGGRENSGWLNFTSTVGKYCSWWLAGFAKDE